MAKKTTERKSSAPKRKVAKKKATKKKTPSTKNTWGNRISDDEGEKLYKLWADTYRGKEGFAGLAREVKRRRTSISQYAKRHGWEGRYLKMLERRERKVDDALVERHVEKAQLIERMAGSAVRALYKEQYIPDENAPGGQRKVLILKADATISDVVRLMRYEDELRDKFPKPPDEATSTVPEEVVRSVLGELNLIGPKGLEALGKLIVEKGHRLDRERQPDDGEDHTTTTD